MINIMDKTCQYENCKKRPNFNFENEKKAKFCSIHKLNGMINVISKTCKTPLCYTHVQDKYEGYCLYCFIHIFPDKHVSRNYKTKEYAVVEYVKNKFPNFTLESDKKNKRRLFKKTT